jgi:adenylate cyclase
MTPTLPRRRPSARRPCPPVRHPPAPGIVVVLFTDLVGSTALLSRAGDDAFLGWVRAHDRAVRRAVTTHGGRLVKHTGDGAMAAFGSASGALAAAVGIRRALADGPVVVPVRVGMSAGEPVAVGDDLFGASVHLAARLCAAAEPGAILASGVVADLALGKGVGFGPRREVALRGFPGPVPACEVLWAGGPAPAPRPVAGVGR